MTKLQLFKETVDDVFGHYVCEDCGNPVIPTHLFVEEQYDYVARNIGECWVCGRTYKLREKDHGF